MRSATAGACGSSRRTPRPRLPPACSFFSGEKKGRAFGAVDVVLQGPQILIPSSGGTTPFASALRRPPIQFIYTSFFVKMLNCYAVIIYNPITTSSENKKQQEGLCEADLICSPSWKEKKQRPILSAKQQLSAGASNAAGASGKGCELES